LRARMVALPPGGNGTTRMMGRLGYGWATAGDAATPSIATNAAVHAYRPAPASMRLLLGLDAHRLDQIGPHRHLAIDQRGIRLRRGALEGEPFAHLIARQHRVERMVELVDDGPRRAGRRRKPPAQRYVVAG